MTADATALMQQIENAAQGLLFPSESDFPIEAFSYGEQEPSSKTLLAQRGLSPDVPVEETTLASFFEGLVEASDDASEQDRVSAERFRTLMNVLEANLEDNRVYRVGTVDIEVFALGRTSSGVWMGVRTNVVET